MVQVPSGCGKASLALAFSVAPEVREVNEIGPALEALATNDDRKNDRPFHGCFHALNAPAGQAMGVAAMQQLQGFHSLADLSAPRRHPLTKAQRIRNQSAPSRLYRFREGQIMRKRLSVFACLGMAAVSVAIMASSGVESEARSKSAQRDFVIAGTDGYGTQDCLASSNDCGRIVANAWCESKGFKGALAYRKLGADEITGSTGSSQQKPVESFLISCKD